MPPAQRKARPRTYDLAKTRTALTAQLTHVREAIASQDESKVAHTAQHITASVNTVTRLLNRPAPAKRDLTAAQWAANAPELAPDTEALDQTALDQAARDLTEATTTAPGDRLLATPAGGIRLDDFLATRCVELVVLTHDLAAALGTEIPYDRQALATATRVLADALAVRAPGGAVEVRIPPFAVVQCVEGPRHTRGTPPGVVETDPLTWLRLATGRTGWAEAVESAAVTASGERADLSAQLPLLT
ncbi:sterol carrier family protein [Streptomyces gamaensis]|uniref:Sterol carrier family protein n=1 Tax=Streptomyces gamaensis TaxID=1763542 RepID=A0ABW0YVN3_9ACTN